MARRSSRLSSRHKTDEGNDASPDIDSDHESPNGNNNDPSPHQDGEDDKILKHFQQTDISHLRQFAISRHKLLLEKVHAWKKQVEAKQQQQLAKQQAAQRTDPPVTTSPAKTTPAPAKQPLTNNSTASKLTPTTTKQQPIAALETAVASSARNQPTKLNQPVSGGHTSRKSGTAPSVVSPPNDATPSTAIPQTSASAASTVSQPTETSSQQQQVKQPSSKPPSQQRKYIDVTQDTVNAGWNAKAIDVTSVEGKAIVEAGPTLTPATTSPVASYVSTPKAAAGSALPANTTNVAAIAVVAPGSEPSAPTLTAPSTTPKRAPVVVPPPAAAVNQKQSPQNAAVTNAPDQPVRRSKREITVATAAVTRPKRVKTEHAVSAAPAPSRSSTPKSQQPNGSATTVMTAPKAVPTRRMNSTDTVYGQEKKKVIKAKKIVVKNAGSADGKVSYHRDVFMPHNALIKRPMERKMSNRKYGIIQKLLIRRHQLSDRIVALRTKNAIRFAAPAPEPRRTRSHWDGLLEEMTWMATDFMEERKFKIAAAQLVAGEVADYRARILQTELKKKATVDDRRRRLASQLSGIVKTFWAPLYSQPSPRERERASLLESSGTSVGVGRQGTPNRKLASSLNASVSNDASKVVVGDAKGEVRDLQLDVQQEIAKLAQRETPAIASADLARKRKAAYVYYQTNLLGTREPFNGWFTPLCGLGGIDARPEQTDGELDDGSEFVPDDDQSDGGDDEFTIAEEERLTQGVNDMADLDLCDEVDCLENDASDPRISLHGKVWYTNESGKFVMRELRGAVGKSIKLRDLGGKDDQDGPNSGKDGPSSGKDEPQVSGEPVDSPDKTEIEQLDTEEHEYFPGILESDDEDQMDEDVVQDDQDESDNVASLVSEYSHPDDVDATLRDHLLKIKSLPTEAELLPDWARGGNGQLAEQVLMPALYRGPQLSVQQFAIVRWLMSMHERALNTIVSECFGMDKAMCLFSFLCILVGELAHEGPHLILAPKAQCQSLAFQSKMLSPGLSVTLLSAEDSLEDLDCRNVVVMAYEDALAVQRVLARYSWHDVVFVDPVAVNADVEKLACLKYQHALVLLERTLSETCDKAPGVHLLLMLLFRSLFAGTVWDESSMGGEKLAEYRGILEKHVRASRNTGPSQSIEVQESIVRCPTSPMEQRRVSNMLENWVNQYVGSAKHGLVKSTNIGHGVEHLVWELFATSQHITAGEDGSMAGIRSPFVMQPVHELCPHARVLNIGVEEQLEHLGRANLLITPVLTNFTAPEGEQIGRLATKRFDLITHFHDLSSRCVVSSDGTSFDAKDIRLRATNMTTIHEMGTYVKPLFGPDVIRLVTVEDVHVVSKNSMQLHGAKRESLFAATRDAVTDMARELVDAAESVFLSPALAVSSRSSSPRERAVLNLLGDMSPGKESHLAGPRSAAKRPMSGKLRKLVDLLASFQRRGDVRKVLVATSHEVVFNHVNQLLSAKRLQHVCLGVGESRALFRYGLCAVREEELLVGLARVQELAVLSTIGLSMEDTLGCTNAVIFLDESLEAVDLDWLPRLVSARCRLSGVETEGTPMQVLRLVSEETVESCLLDAFLGDAKNVVRFVDDEEDGVSSRTLALEDPEHSTMNGWLHRALDKHANSALKYVRGLVVDFVSEHSLLLMNGKQDERDQPRKLIEEVVEASDVDCVKESFQRQQLPAGGGFASEADNGGLTGDVGPLAISCEGINLMENEEWGEPDEEELGVYGELFVKHWSKHSSLGDGPEHTITSGDDEEDDAKKLARIATGDFSLYYEKRANQSGEAGYREELLRLVTTGLSHDLNIYRAPDGGQDVMVGPGYQVALKPERIGVAASATVPAGEQVPGPTFEGYDFLENVQMYIISYYAKDVREGDGHGRLYREFDLLPESSRKRARKGASVEDGEGEEFDSKSRSTSKDKKRKKRAGSLDALSGQGSKKRSFAEELEESDSEVVDWGIGVPKKIHHRKMKASLKRVAAEDVTDILGEDGDMWTSWEDAAILRAVDLFGPNWELVASLVNSQHRNLSCRSGRQLYERYHVIKPNGGVTAAGSPSGMNDLGEPVRKKLSNKDIGYWATPALHKRDLLFTTHTSGARKGLSSILSTLEGGKGHLFTTPLGLSGMEDSGHKYWMSSQRSILRLSRERRQVTGTSSRASNAKKKRHGDREAPMKVDEEGRAKFENLKHTHKELLASFGYVPSSSQLVTSGIARQHAILEAEQKRKTTLLSYTRRKRLINYQMNAAAAGKGATPRGQQMRK